MKSLEKAASLFANKKIVIQIRLNRAGFFAL